MKHIIVTGLTASALLFAVQPANGLGRVGVTNERGTPVVVPPQQTFLISNHQAVIVPRPFLFPQHGVFISGVAVPSGFVAFRTFHHHFGHVIVFVNPNTFVVWPSGFWWWSGAQWTWAAQTIVW